MPCSRSTRRTSGLKLPPISRPIRRRYDSLTRQVMAAHWYERYAQDMFGVCADGHPDSRRLVHHENVPAGTHPLRKDFAWDTRLAHANEPYPMGRVEGEGIFQIPVGPIHAGIIEPGHFRFNVAGERIITLEGKLFFTHKGVEKLLEGRSVADAMPFVERVSGDAAASHALAFCQAVETIAGCEVPDAPACCASWRSSSSGSPCTCTMSRTSAGWAPATR